MAIVEARSPLQYTRLPAGGVDVARVVLPRSSHF